MRMSQAAFGVIFGLDAHAYICSAPAAKLASGDGFIRWKAVLEGCPALQSQFFVGAQAWVAGAKRNMYSSAVLQMLEACSRLRSCLREQTVMRASDGGMQLEQSPA